MAQAGPADEDGGFYKGAGGVTQKDPVDGVVDGGFEAGAVEVNIVKVEVLFEAKIEGGGGVVRRDPSSGKQGDEPGVDSAQSDFVDDVGEAVAGAFGEGFDSFDSSDLQEPLKDVTVGGADAEVAVVHAFEMPGDVAAKGEDTVATEGFDARCGGSLGVEFLVPNTEGDEVVFETRGVKDFVDANEELAFLTVFFAALNFR